VNPEELACRRWRPVKRIVERRDALASQMTAANTQANLLRDKHAQAIQTDRAVRAQGLAAGKRVDSNEAESVRAALEHAERQAADLQTALQVVERDLVELRNAERETWQAERVTMLVRAEQDLQQAQERLADEQALRDWVAEPVQMPVFSEQELPGLANFGLARAEAQAANTACGRS
jgi:hypothetical protein